MVAASELVSFVENQVLDKIGVGTCEYGIGETVGVVSMVQWYRMVGRMVCSKSISFDWSDMSSYTKSNTRLSSSIQIREARNHHTNFEQDSGKDFADRYMLAE